MECKMVNGSILSAEDENQIGSFVRTVDKRLYEKYLQRKDTIGLIAGGGSDRRFFRIKTGGESIIFMLSSPGDEEFQNYLFIAQFLRDTGTGVPVILDANRENHFLFMEDVGDGSLYQKFRNGLPEEELEYWYKKVLQVLAHMQIEGGRNWAACPPLCERTFDYSALRWETEYFQQYFVERYLRLSITNDQELSQEFEALARRVAEEPLQFMHRDFQSQNIMVHQGEIKILDFQGARRGLLHYDAASLLKDAYVVLPARILNALMSFYLEALDEQGFKVTDVERFLESFALAGLQRNMQALGAFAYLSLVKGKTWFRQHIPAGVNHLTSALRKRSDFPHLQALIERVSRREFPVEGRTGKRDSP